MKHLPSTVKTMALAVALSLPAAPLFAATMADIVTTRDDQDVHQQYGRDSVYAMQTREPAQTESRVSSGDSSGVKEFFAVVGSAGAAAWDKVTGLFEPGSASVAAAPTEPQRYGRAGGYIGTDQLALLERVDPAAMASEPVTTGESLAIREADRDARYPAASEAQLYGSDEDRFAGDQRSAAGSESVTTGESPLFTPGDSQYRGNAEELSSTPSTRREGVTGESQSLGANDESSVAPSEAPVARSTAGQDAAEQSAPSPDAVTVEDLEEVTDQTAEAGARRQPDEVGSDATEIRTN